MNEKIWNCPESNEEMPEIFMSDPELLLNWYTFNDTDVKPVNGLSLQELFGDGKSNKNAYILFYERCDYVE
jgi:ubiquitin C-terminal hydrolase